MSSTAHGSAKHAAVLGSPVAHSKSPQLHLAAYRALGLRDWTYDRVECTAEQLPGVVGAFDDSWVGVSVTMPGKFAALRVADERTPRAEQVGSANTLVHTASGWLADNTDVDGVAGALGPVPGHVVVIGAGGTAPAAVVGAVEQGAGQVTVVARDAGKARPVVDLATSLGAQAHWCDFTDPSLPDVVAGSAVISTVPADAAAAHVGTFARAAVLLDAIYDPWPTPLARAVEARGGRVVGGLEMLLNQAFRQVELFTGHPAPKDAMREALRAR